ncbi:MAG TPA: hypothetical protein VIW02_00550 [Gammaproteobacteria bacterium]
MNGPAAAADPAPRPRPWLGALLLLNVACVVGAEWGRLDWLHYPAAASCLAALVLLAPRVRWSRQLFLLIGTLLTVAVFVLAPEPWRALWRALNSMTFIAGLFVALATLRNAAAGSLAIVRCGLYLADQPPGRRYLALTTGGHLFALVLNYGAISLFGGLIERSLKAEPEPTIRAIRTRRMLLAVQRGFITTLLWSPLTFSMVISLSVVPGAKWASVLPYSTLAALLLGATGWALDTLFKPKVAVVPPRKPQLPGAWRALLPLLGLLVLLMGLVGTLQGLTGLRTVAVVMLVVPLLSLAWIGLQKRPPHAGEAPVPRRLRLLAFLDSDLPNYASELVLLMMAGYIGVLTATLLGPAIGHDWLGPHASPLLLVGVLWVVLLAGQVGMNPILSVTLLGPLLPTAVQLGVDPELIVLALVSGWALTGASSPFTATVMLVGAFGKVSPHRAGLVWNGAFTLVGGAVLSLWLLAMVLLAR